MKKEFSLFSRRHRGRHAGRDERREKQTRERWRFRPLLLSKLLGPRALRPPPAELEPPPAPSREKLPKLDVEGTPVPSAQAGLAALDAVDPAVFARDRREDPHWDGKAWHDGAIRGLVRNGEWLSLAHDGSRWWAFAGGRAELRHDGVWWTKENGVWLVVHDGQPWAWRSFQDWGAQGLFHPGSGTEMVYSKDFARVAIITPGEGARIFNAETGEEMGRISVNRLPPRRRPKAPPDFDAIRGVFDR